MAYNQLQAAAKKHPELEHSKKLLANLQNTFGLLLQVNRFSELLVMDLYPCCVYSVELYEPVFQANLQSLEWNLDEHLETRPRGLGTVKGNYALLMQSLCTLLGNASKYSPDGATIHLGIRDSEDHLRIECANLAPILFKC